jgi:hypothetical protein
MIKFFYHAGYLQMYNYALFMVTASTLRGPKPIYGGVYMIEEYGQGLYYLT